MVGEVRCYRAHAAIEQLGGYDLEPAGTIEERGLADVQRRDPLDDLFRSPGGITRTLTGTGLVVRTGRTIAGAFKGAGYGFAFSVVSKVK